MHILEVLYYNYYKYAKKIVKDDTPLWYAWFILSFIITNFIFEIVEIITNILFCTSFLGFKLYLFGTAILIFYCTYVYFIRHRKSYEVIRNKPSMFSNQKFSVVFTIIFSLLALSFMFWGVPYSRMMANRCR